jgi:hypothetical protein
MMTRCNTGLRKVALLSDFCLKVLPPGIVFVVLTSAMVAA